VVAGWEEAADDTGMKAAARAILSTAACSPCSSHNTSITGGEADVQETLPPAAVSVVLPLLS
jgi:hypothetical protein